MDYILNELSVNQVEDIHLGRELLKNFVLTGIAVQEKLKLDSLRIHESVGKNLYLSSITSDYLISQWLNDTEVSRDLQDRFRLITTSSPLLNNEELFELELSSRSEFHIDKTSVYGLGISHILDTLCVSFLTHEKWNKSSIDITHYCLSENGESDITPKSVKHASSPEHIDEHVDYFKTKELDNIHTSTDLWHNRLRILPNIVLCGKVEEQLTNGINSKFLNQIIDRLIELNAFSEAWKAGNFSYHDLNNSTNLNCSPESDSTMRKYGAQRKFRLPNEDKKTFELHIKTGDLRFHFYPDDHTKTVYVGYIGKHLPTVTDK